MTTRCSRPAIRTSRRARSPRRASRRRAARRQGRGRLGLREPVFWIVAGVVVSAAARRPSSRSARRTRRPARALAGHPLRQRSLQLSTARVSCAGQLQLLCRSRSTSRARRRVGHGMPTSTSARSMIGSGASPWPKVWIEQPSMKSIALALRDREHGLLAVRDGDRPSPQRASRRCSPARSARRLLRVLALARLDQGLQKPLRSARGLRHIEEEELHGVGRDGGGGRRKRDRVGAGRRASSPAPCTRRATTREARSTRRASFADESLGSLAFAPTALRA